MVAFVLVLAPSFASSLAGTVRSSPDGEPLSGVAVYALDLRLNYAGVLTDSDGAFRIDSLSAGGWRLWALPPDEMDRVPRFHPDARDYCDAGLVWLAEDEDRDGFDFALSAGSVLTGRLIDASGEPVAGATLTARGTGELEGLWRQATSDSEGTFRVVGLESGGGEWACEVDALGFPAQWLGGVYDDDLAEAFEPADLGEFTVLSGIAVSGVVDGPDGPQAGATVHVYSSSSTFGGTGQVVTVATGDDGTYTATGLPPGEVLPWTQTGGLALTYWPDSDRPDGFLLEESEGGSLVSADLFPPVEATFRASLAGEGDLSGVTAMLLNDEETVGFGERASEDGSVAISGLHGGDYFLYVYAADEGYRDDYVRDDDGLPAVFALDAGVENGPFGIDLVPGASVSGALTDDRGGPVYGGWVVGEHESGETAAAMSGSDGTFRMGGLVAGSWTFSVGYGAYCADDPGYVPLWWPGVPLEDLRTWIGFEGDEDRTGLDFVLPRDDDHDGMSDEWEEEHGLDPDRDDAGEDPDGDGYTNLDEYLLDTDPREAAPDGLEGCGCGGGSDEAWVLLPLAAVPWRRARTTRRTLRT